ncbi:MAG: amidohydrolase [Clostridia bacterium]|nr:amidohydrolase [Clostridia bacterium]
MKIIDSHVHLAEFIHGRGASGELRAIGKGEAQYTDGTVLKLIPDELGEYSVTPEAVIRLMDRYNVEKAVLLQGDFLGYQTMYSYEAMKRYPDRFLAAATYDPFCKNRDRIVRHLFEQLEFRVVKFECSLGSGLMSAKPVFSLDGEIMEREFAFLDDHGITTVIDIGALGSESCQVDALKTSIKRHPSARFVVCHLLAPRQHMEAQMCEALRALALPNVWFDIASLQHNVEPDPEPYPIARRFLLDAVKIAGCDKILFGTDLPSNLCRYSYDQLIGLVAAHDALSENEKNLILYENAKKLFFE